MTSSRRFLPLWRAGKREAKRTNAGIERYERYEESLRHSRSYDPIINFYDFDFLFVRHFCICRRPTHAYTCDGLSLKYLSISETGARGIMCDDVKIMLRDQIHKMALTCFFLLLRELLKRRNTQTENKNVIYNLSQRRKIDVNSIIKFDFVCSLRYREFPLWVRAVEKKEFRCVAK